MSYKVKVKQLSEIEDEERVDGRKYPEEGLESTDGISGATNSSTKVVTNLLLLYSEKTGLRAKLSRHKKYRVVLVQDKSETKNLCFELFSSNEYSLTKAAFSRLHSTLFPLISLGQMFFTRELVTSIILPEPKEPEMIGLHLVELMEKSPTSHPEWVDVIQSLLKTDSGPKPAPMDPVETKLAYFKHHFNANTPSGPVHESAIAVNVGVVSASLPLLSAMPTTATTHDEEISERVWNNFRRGTLTKFDSRAEDKVKTWLIEAVEKNYLKSSTKLILSGVFVNDQHPETGDTALHIAVRSGNLALVQLLLAYHADLMIPNANDETPLSIAKTLTCKAGSEIVLALDQIKELRDKAKKYYSENFELPEKGDGSGTFLLSMDGGGMRSVIMCHLLAAVKTRMDELEDSNRLLRSYFDYIAGTSAGAIIGGLIAYTDIKVSLAGMYIYKFMVDVFGTPKAERGIKLKEYIVEMVGETTPMSAVKSGNTIITGTIANVSPNMLHLMTSYGRARDGQLGPDDRKVWEALVASSAAPTYFPAFGPFLDGGLMANNPTLPAMTDILRHSKETDSPKREQIKCVLSLGTGYNHPEPVENYEVFVPGFTIDVAKTLFHSSMGLVSLLSHFAEQTTQSNGPVVSQAETWCDSIGASFFRLSPPLSKQVAPDMNSIEELASLLFETEIYVLKECSSIDKIAKTILSK